jgi:hypothetical protein
MEGMHFRLLQVQKTMIGVLLNFFFPSPKRMTKVVGVGLECAKVVVCMKSFNVKVISIGENAW